MIFSVLVTLYLAIMLVSLYMFIVKTIRASKYGKGVFKLNSKKYKKDIKAKKEFLVPVAPFADVDKVYLPLTAVAKLIGIKNITESEDYKLIIKFSGKNIKVDNDNIVTLSNGYNNKKKFSDVQVKNDHVMIESRILRDLFGIYVEIVDDKVILR